MGLDAGNRVRFEAAGLVDNGDARFLSVLDEAGEGSLVAIEKPMHVFPGRDMGEMVSRGKQIAATRDAAATIRTLAHVRGQVVVEMTANTWRRALCGKGIRGTAGDKRVAEALAMVVVEMPRRSNEHTRDALGLAVVVLRGRGTLLAAKTVF